MRVWERAPDTLWRRSGDRRILMGSAAEDVRSEVASLLPECESVGLVASR